MAVLDMGEGEFIIKDDGYTVIEINFSSDASDIHLNTRVSKVLFNSAQDEELDFAILEIEPLKVPLVPIQLSSMATPKKNDMVLAIGYPASDKPEDDADAFEFAKVLLSIFKNKYSVKRASPGYITEPLVHNKNLKHDCTTLGGSSGSVIIDLNTLQAVGIHYSGRYKVSNTAVLIKYIKEALEKIK